MNREILWTKIYKIYHSQGDFSIITAEHPGQVFYATVLYYRRGADPTGETLGILHFDAENFSGTSAEQVYGEAEKWVDETFGPDYTVVEKEI